MTTRCVALSCTYTHLHPPCAIGIPCATLLHGPVLRMPPSPTPPRYARPTQRGASDARDAAMEAAGQLSAAQPLSSGATGG